MNNAARPGDALILTKPIGSGTLTTAAKKELIPESDLAECIAVMSTLNKAASEAMTVNSREPSAMSHEPGNAPNPPDVSTIGSFGSRLTAHGSGLSSLLAHAATDITGFGLIGHAFEMADASGVTLRIIASQVPLMTHALRLAEQGCLTRVHKATLEHVGNHLRVDGVESVLVSLLADAQTSGGLLISTGEPDRLLDEMKSRGVTAAVIGDVHPRENAVIDLAD